MRVYGVTAGTINIFNNVFYKVKSGINLDVSSTNAASYNTQNNIFKECSTEAVKDSSVLGKFALNYNIFHSNANDVSTEANTPTIKGANDRTADPLFTSAATGDFSLLINSPAIDAGISTGAPTTDYAGKQRYDDPDVANTGSGAFPYYDIGAYEYVLPPNPTFTSPSHPSHIAWYSNPSVAMTLTSSGSSTTNYRYLVSQDATPTQAQVLAGTFDTDGSFTADISSSGQWYIHTLAVNLDNEPSTNYYSYGVKVDATAPAITSVSSSPSSDSATITWATNEASSSQVDYGLTSAYGNATTETDTATRVTSHSVALSGLNACTTYYYRVHSKDSLSNEAISEANVFTTTGCLAPLTAAKRKSSYGYYLSNIGGPSAETTFTTTGVAGSSVTFDATNLFSGQDIVKYVWDFGDGTTSEGKIVDHTYTAPGRYTVTVTGYDKDGKKTIITDTVDIVPPAPSIDNITSDGMDLLISGTAYANDTIYLTIRSDPYTDKTQTNKDGKWEYRLATASEAIGEGTHTVSAIDSYKLADNTELKSASTDDTKFKVSVDDGKLKVEMIKTRNWRTTALIFGGIIIVLIGAGYVLRRRKVAL